MNRFKGSLLTACSLGLATLAPWAHGQSVQAYRFVDLGTVNNLYTTANAINDAGQITGHSHDGTNNRAYRITPVLSNGVLTWFQGSGNINSLMSVVTTDSTHPYSDSVGINQWGELAGQALGSGYTLPQNAFFWRADLSGVKLSANQSYARAINDIHSSIGTIIPAKGGGNLETIWRLVNGSFVATTIPFPAGAYQTMARGMNNLDQVVGTFSPINNGPSQPILWLPTPAYGLPSGTNLLPLPLGATKGLADGMKDTGEITGRVDDQPGIWTPGTNGFSFRRLIDIQTVPDSPGNGLLQDRATIWDSATGTRDLNVLTVNAPQGSLTGTSAVNTGGLIIGNYTLTTGSGNSSIRAFLLLPNTTLPAASSAPLAPSGLSGTNGVNQVQLSWTNGSNDQNGFQISRSTDGVYPKQIAWTGANALSFTDLFEDSSYAPAFKYTYRISAFNVAGYSTGTTLEVVTSGAPLAPSSVKALASTAPIRINVTWKNNTNTQDFAAIERSDNGTSFAPLTILASATVTSYTDTSVVASHTYYYRSRAHSTNGSYSAYSAVVSATTPRK